MTSESRLFVRNSAVGLFVLCAGSLLLTDTITEASRPAFLPAGVTAVHLVLEVQSTAVAGCLASVN